MLRRRFISHWPSRRSNEGLGSKISKVSRISKLVTIIRSSATSNEEEEEAQVNVEEDVSTCERTCLEEDRGRDGF